MHEVFLPRNKYSGSLLYRLLLSFIAIILLLVSFNVLTFTFFRSSIRDEIIKNSSLNLDAAVTSYEKNVKLVKSMMVSLHFNNKIEFLKNNPQQFDYYMVSQVQKDLQNTLANNPLFLTDVMYYFPHRDYVLDKDGPRNTETMFGRFYASPQYTPDFWASELAKPFSFRVYPAAEFNENTSFSSRPLGRFIPIVFKSAATDDFAIIGLLDSVQMLEATGHMKSDSDFFILDESGMEMFSASNRKASFRMGAHSGDAGHYLERTNYYFYRKGPETGLTYVITVPFATISEQIFNLNLIMTALIIISAVIGIAVSILFARRFNNPLSAIIGSIQQMDKRSPPSISPIREFNVISEKLHDLFQTNETIHRDLINKNSLLQHYAYLNKVKMIHTDIGDAKLSIDSDRPYRIVLYHLLYKNGRLAEMGMDPNRASYYIKEFVHSLFTQTYRDSLTFQIEKDQIVTIVFSNGTEPEALDGLLQEMHKIFELDASYCAVTIAVSPINDNALEFSETFEHALQLSRQRKLGDGVQIIREIEPLPPDLWFAQPAMKEFTANLLSGNDAITVPLVAKTLEQAAKKGASYFQMQELAKEIVNLTIKTLYASHHPNFLLDGKRNPADALKDCRTLEQFQRFFEKLLIHSASATKQKKEATDHITSFVKQYVNEHFGSDLSLDLLAEKLNITGAYLSTYFKEKTETNFSDYVNTVRMNKAMELLQKTDLKIQDVAGLVGYYTVASFNRMFKKHTGVTPSEYRRARTEAP